MAILMLKTVSADGTAYDGFRWPLEVGAVVTAPDWDPKPECGHGLHGLPWGEGKASLLDWSPSAIWIVFETDYVVVFDGKAKCRQAIVRYVGDQVGATTYLRQHGKPNAAIVGEHVIAGHKGIAVLGDRGRAIVGSEGTIRAGRDVLAIVGDCGYADARENSIAVGGKFATVMVGNNGIAIAGYGGDVAVMERGIAVVGENGRASAGPDGIICIAWMDGERRRLAVGYIGEDDGLLPNTVYRFDATTKRFIPVMTETSEAMTP